MTKTVHDSETIATGRQVFTACAFIHHDFDGVTKLFAPKRAASKKFLPNVYELPGGHIDFGEDMVAGLKREIQEEFGMSIHVGDPFAVFTYTNPVKGSHSIEVVYFAEFEAALEQIKLNPEDHATFGWFAETELAQIMSANKNVDDDEIKAIKKGFALLRGEPLRF